LRHHKKLFDMRGADTFTESLFLMKQLDDFVPAGHPLRTIRGMVNKALVAMDGLFADMYEAHIKGGRPSFRRVFGRARPSHHGRSDWRDGAVGRSVCPTNMVARGGWHMLPDFWAFALIGVAAWLLIKQQRSVVHVLGLCMTVGWVVQALR
jgi:hypothetical protein